MPPARSGLFELIQRDALVHIGAEVEQQADDLNVPVVYGDA
jgi:hypothetical protein